MTASGKADTIAILLLAELLYYHRYDGSLEFQKDYQFFSRKFQLTDHQIREAFIRLEGLGLMKRALRTLEINGRKQGNVMFVILYLERLIAFCPHPQAIDRDQTDEEAEAANEPAKFFAQGVGNSLGGSLENSQGHLDKSEEAEERSRSKEQATAVFSQPVQEPQGLAAFYPISKATGEKLQRSSGREFSLRAINELLKALARQSPHYRFPNHVGTGAWQGIDQLELIGPPVGEASSRNQGATVPMTGVWGRIRQHLVQQFGTDGQALDRAWFSKLRPEEDEKSKTLTLQASTPFYRDWIQNNYLTIIERLAADYQVAVACETGFVS